jgi:signal transduction histidine kinase
LQQLAAVLSHRLGSLTSTIAGYADLLVDTPSVSEQRAIAMNVLEASKQIDDLLADLKYFSSPMEPVMRPVDVRTVVRETADLVEPGARARVKWAVKPDAASEIRADPRLLRQALFSLLQNALEAGASSTVVRLHAVAPDDASPFALSFDVWNEGEVGLHDPEDMFRPFFTTHAQRLGLGLPIATRIAEQHGGTVALTVNEAAAGGTCFSLRL